MSALARYADDLANPPAAITDWQAPPDHRAAAPAMPRRHVIQRPAPLTAANLICVLAGMADPDGPTRAGTGFRCDNPDE